MTVSLGERVFLSVCLSGCLFMCVCVCVCVCLCVCGYVCVCVFRVDYSGSPHIINNPQKSPLRNRNAYQESGVCVCQFVFECVGVFVFVFV